MSEWQPEVVRVGEVVDLANSDALSITQIYGEGGYPCIVKRGSFKPGDLAAYVPIDSIVNTTRPEFAFLARDGRSTERITAKRLRGTFSMGLLIPAPAGLREGEDVSALLGLAKWEPPPLAFRTGPGTGGLDEADPGVMPTYTDIEGLRRWPEVLQEGEEVIITEKIHGENFRAVHDGERLWVGSRTRIKKEAEDSRWWMAAHGLGLGTLLSTSPLLIVFGEAHGYTGGFPYGAGKGTAALRLFDAMDAKTRTYLDYDAFVKFASDRDLPIAPVLYRGPWSNDLRQLAEGPSTIDSTHCREGIVIRPARERWHPSCGRVILKLHGQEFLLKTVKGAKE